MQITKQQLLAIMPNAKNRVDTYIGWINQLAPQFSLDRPMRMAMFLAQVAHESGELRYTEEIDSGAAYEGRKDLENTQRGDGIRYKGRGLLQVTGRKNYTAYKAYCGYDVVAQPELLSQPKGAVRSAMWVFKQLGCIPHADRGDVKTVTKRINGGYNGLSSRMLYWARAKKAFGL